MIISVMRDSEALTTFRSSASSNSLQMTSRLSTSLDSSGGSPPTGSAVLDALNAELDNDHTIAASSASSRPPLPPPLFLGAHASPPYYTMEQSSG